MSLLGDCDFTTRSTSFHCWGPVTSLLGTRKFKIGRLRLICWEVVLGIYYDLKAGAL